MGLAEAIADVIDILRGRPAGGGGGPDDWKAAWRDARELKKAAAKRSHRRKKATK